MMKRIHHLTFVVHDLDEASCSFRKLFGEPLGPPEDLPARGVRAVRFRLGDLELVAVQPTDSEGIPAKYLEQHGPGLFLVSFEVDDLDAAIESAAARGIQVRDQQPRQGLADWRVADLEPSEFCGAHLQWMDFGKGV